MALNTNTKPFLINNPEAMLNRFNINEFQQSREKVHYITNTGLLQSQHNQTGVIAGWIGSNIGKVKV
jgi:hypothetical protein